MHFLNRFLSIFLLFLNLFPHVSLQIGLFLHSKIGQPIKPISFRAQLTKIVDEPQLFNIDINATFDSNENEKFYYLFPILNELAVAEQTFSSIEHLNLMTVRTNQINYDSLLVFELNDIFEHIDVRSGRQTNGRFNAVAPHLALQLGVEVTQMCDFSQRAETARLCKKKWLNQLPDKNLSITVYEDSVNLWLI